MGQSARRSIGQSVRYFVRQSISQSTIVRQSVSPSVSQGDTHTDRHKYTQIDTNIHRRKYRHRGLSVGPHVSLYMCICVHVALNLLIGTYTYYWIWYFRNVVVIVGRWWRGGRLLGWWGSWTRLWRSRGWLCDGLTPTTAIRTTANWMTITSVLPTRCSYRYGCRWRSENIV